MLAYLLIKCALEVACAGLRAKPYRGLKAGRIAACMLRTRRNS